MRIKVLTYNIQSCRDFFGSPTGTQEKLAAFIGEQVPDAVVLNEVHDRGPSDAFSAQAEEIAGLLHYHFRFAKAIDIPDIGPYGNAVLSPHPIERFSVTPVPLRPGESGEARCILRAEIRKDGTAFAVYGSHFGLSEHEQYDAVTRAAALLDDEELPYVFMGDFNLTKDSPILAPLFERAQDTASAFDAPKLSFPSDKPVSKIDYILASHNMRVLHADIPAAVISDHRPHIAELAL